MTKVLIFALILSTTALFTHVPQAHASLAPVGEPASTRSADMKTVSSALESKVLRARLKAMGLDDAETDARLKKLSDKEIHQLASSIEAVQPGGFVVELLVIAALVLVIVYFAKRV